MRWIFGEERHGRRREMCLSGTRLNLGCGSQVPDGWINVDYALGARAAKVPGFAALSRVFGLFRVEWSREIYLHDLTREFPWADSSVDVVYSSHTLEHMSREDGARFLAECHRVLRRDGIMRIVVPDLEYNVGEYVRGQIRADEFVEKLGVLCEGSRGVLKGWLSPWVQFPHRCMYDTRRLLEILDDIGMEAASRAAFESDIEDIRSVELKERVKNAVVVEGRKR
jgi:SAM-dependent methyltransferase